MIRWQAAQGMSSTSVVSIVADAIATPRVDTQVASPVHLRISHDGEGRIWAAGSPDRWGVCAFAKKSFRLLNPIAASECRQVRSAHPEEAAWWMSWAFRFSEALALNGPIGPGAWALERAEIVSPEAWRANFERSGMAFRLVEFDADLHDARFAETQIFDVDWGIGGTNVYLPLRPLTRNDEGRLKAFRKLARVHALPPVLLWWHAGLQGSIVLDGHVRCEAFRLEELPVRALLLSAIRPTPGAGEAEQLRIDRAAQIDRHISDPVLKGQVLQRLYDEPVTHHFTTSARPLPGGRIAWEADVEQASPEYLSAATKFLHSPTSRV